MAFNLYSIRAQSLLGTALVFTSGATAVAQDETVDPDVFSLDSIEVRMNDTAGLAADRATAAYVSEADLERSRMGELKDLFAGIASVSVGGAIPVA